MVLALVAAVSFALSLVITLRDASGGVLFAAHPGLAVGRRRPGGPHRRPVAPTTATAAAITGWAGLALILLACTRLSATTLYPGTAALLPVLGAALVIGAGCAAPTQGCGRVLAVVADAGDRADLLLVVSVALAGAGARTGIARPPVGPGRWVALAALLSGGLAVLTLRFIENPLRFAASIAQLCRRQSRAGRCRHRGSGRGGRGAAGMGAHPGRTRRAGCRR